MQWYCVIEIATGRVVGEPTPRPGDAAKWLVPGTCYGWGDDANEAVKKAHLQRRRFLE